MAINAINIGNNAPSVGELKLGFEATVLVTLAPGSTAEIASGLNKSPPATIFLTKLFNSFNLADHIC